MAVVVVAAAFPAAASRDMSVLRHVTLISFLSLAFMASLVVAWPEKRRRLQIYCWVEERGKVYCFVVSNICSDIFSFLGV